MYFLETIVVISGGNGANGAPLSSVEVLILDDQNGLQSTTCSMEDLPIALTGHQMVLSPDSRSLIVCGGSNPGYKPSTFDTCYGLEKDTAVWQTTIPPMKKNRTVFGMTTIRGVATIAVGGETQIPSIIQSNLTEWLDTEKISLNKSEKFDGRIWIDAIQELSVNISLHCVTQYKSGHIAAIGGAQNGQVRKEWQYPLSKRFFL